MRLIVVSSKEDIHHINPNERMVHLAFRPSNMDVMSLINQCPRLRAVQIPPSYYRTMSDAARQFLEIQGVTVLKGDVWGHRKDIDEYYQIDEEIVEKITSLLEKGNSIEETVKKVENETKMSEDLIKYILKENVKI